MRKSKVVDTTNQSVFKPENLIKPNGESGCWLWKWPMSTFGAKKSYGSVTVNGKIYRAHKAAWLEVHGSVPEGHGVLHKCDTIRCVNPDHLFTGTQKENITDMMAKGRHGPYKGGLDGESNGWSKLMVSDIKEIRALKGKLSQRKIAKLYNTTQSNINDILLGKRWKSCL